MRDDHGDGAAGAITLGRRHDAEGGDPPFVADRPDQEAEGDALEGGGER
ncbi:MAG: hypothetical protein AVDCRST_MAG88-3709 [uncultured Thermomicrobiales bacterium]|uniref:Uncharacterized protein n=1 Tax=uncultured Thermomicrobiales bacterium TaxID=1645740 RepID=A0A6J4VSI1_9BACT|nr:MAG: hypothetical protein AVDCRST_MAG88-3709 [uncultured Thermomicrobiales bacterium]